MFNLRRMLEGMGAQANPFDGGKTFASVNKKPAQAIARGAGAGGAGQIVGRAAGGASRRLHVDDGTGFQRMPNGKALVNGAVYPAGTQEDSFPRSMFQQPQLQASNFSGYGQANYRGYEDFPTPAVQNTQQAEITQPGWSPSLQGAQGYFTGQSTRPGASLQGLQGSDTGDYRRFIGY